jgi:lipoate-protein ligase A
VDLEVRLEGAAPGEANMARDCALGAEAARSGRALLRLYAWSPPAVSLGYHQAAEGACDADACRALGWDVVRRPTGGRAVCHAADEVTYAVALPAAAAPAGVLDCYAWLAGGLLLAYRRLGLPAELARGGRAESRTGACFDAPAAHEICCAGRKVAGSAQVRREGFVLQHGSLPLAFDPGLHARLLGLPPAAARRLARRAAGIADFLDPPPAWAEVAAAVADGLVQALAAGPPNAAACGDGGDGR